MRSYVFLTEASQEVGYGHLFECLAVSKEFEAGSCRFCLMQSSDNARKVVEARGYRCEMLDSVITGDEIHEGERVLMNTRKNLLDFQTKVRKSSRILVLIDEFGQKDLDCDVVVNFSVCSEWLNYGHREGNVKELFGPGYYPLRDEFRHVKRVRGGRKSRILVSMGGVDRTRATMEVAKVLSKLSGIAVTYIIGPGFKIGIENIMEFVDSERGDRVLNNLSIFADLMADHDVFVGAGGNSLYEASYIGLPTLVAWEDEHERVQGEEFENRGVAKVIGRGCDVDCDEIMRKVDSILNDDELLARMRRNGLALLDKWGARRIAWVLDGVYKNDIL